MTVLPASADRPENSRCTALDGSVEIVSRAELAQCSHWRTAFAGRRKDYRYYELVEDTIRHGFDYHYFAIKKANGVVRAIQPFFTVDQDILEGVPPNFQRIVHLVRLLWPGFLVMRTLMIGCAVGEGHLDGDQSSYVNNAHLLAKTVVTHAQNLKAPLIVLKEFPARYREPLKCVSVLRLYPGAEPSYDLPQHRLSELR